MYRATTPKLTLEIEDDVDLTQATDVYVTLCDSRFTTLLEKHSTDVVVESKNVVSVTLTQAESLALPLGTAYVQVNWLYMEGSALRRGATDRGEVTVYRNNKEVVIE